MKAYPTAIAVLLCGLAACAATPKYGEPGEPTKPDPGTTHYSAAETKKLGLCLAVTQHVKNIAERKLDGTPEAYMENYYAGTAVATDAVPLVRKIYADQFSHSWDYATEYFQDCGEQEAGVSAKRSGTAMFCMLDVLIAETARTMRGSGASKQAVYDYIGVGPEKFGDRGKYPIDLVYAPATVPGKEIEEDIWNSCMAPVTDPD